MQLKLIRGAVHASDEPEAETIRVAEGSTLRELLAIVKRTDYLASIQGDKATWSAHVDGVPAAIVAQEWDEPKFVVPPDTRYCGKTLALRFKYHAQTPPDEVFEELSRNGTS